MIRERSPPFAEISQTTTPRSTTVQALYQKLNRHRLILVRGTPGSGKSTLATLLMDYIRDEENVEPVSWRNDLDLSWLDRLHRYGYDSKGPNVIIIDDFQESHGNSEFWNNYVKAIDDDHRDRVILFASYGSPTAKPFRYFTSTPIVIPNNKRVQLQPVDHKDGITPIGLLLTKEEFDDMVARRYPRHRLSEDVLDHIFGITAGQVGAIKDLLRIIFADDSYRQVRTSNGWYSLDTLWSQLPIEKIWRGLEEGGSIFKRGLPELDELQQPAITRVFRGVLGNGAASKDMFKSTEDQEALQRCWKSGWLHATQNPPIYVFTTPLHQGYIEYYLGNESSDSLPVPDQNLRTFMINVIRHFSSQQLSKPRVIGTSELQRPPEAQYQDEFYRCCYQYSGGSLISFSEFGNAGGRVEFYLPLKKWGVELLRDGKRLENHSSRFEGQGAYANMGFEDYILLDFRTTVPRKAHPEILKLYHVVFRDNYREVKILKGSSLELVETFTLLNHQ